VLFGQEPGDGLDAGEHHRPGAWTVPVGEIE
jgi:hypothetical protein